MNSLEHGAVKQEIMHGKNILLDTPPVESEKSDTQNLSCKAKNADSAANFLTPNVNRNMDRLASEASTEDESGSTSCREL